MHKTIDVQETDDGATGRGRARRWHRYWPLVALAFVVALAFAFDLHRLLSFDMLQAHSTTLQDAVDDRPAMTAFGFVAGYAAAVALSLPGVVILTMAGGLFFGTWLGGVLAISGATSGALLVFLAARTSLGQRLAARAGPWIERLRAGFQENAWSYLVVLRILPVAPFIVVNVGAALLGVRLRTYVLATVLGILPGSFVYAGVGSGLGAVLASGERLDLQVMLEPAILGPFLALAGLALLPVGYKWARHRGWLGG
jgi:uncharacterized membrane protein YdjX (TVP38/TMEM64 family)